MKDEVCKAANALIELGVKTGDRVAIYMPMIPEAVMAMLACARIGAPHTVVFGGFSSDALASRFTDLPGQGGHHLRRRATERGAASARLRSSTGANEGQGQQWVLLGNARPESRSPPVSISAPTSRAPYVKDQARFAGGRRIASGTPNQSAANSRSRKARTVIATASSISDS